MAQQQNARIAALLKYLDGIDPSLAQKATGVVSEAFSNQPDPDPFFNQPPPDPFFNQPPPDPFFNQPPPDPFSNQPEPDPFTNQPPLRG